MTVNDRLRDEAISHALFVSRYSTGVSKRMVKILNQSDAELSIRLQVALDDLSPNSFTVRRLEGLLGSVRQINQTAIQAAFTNLGEELQTFADHEAGYHLSLFESLIPAPVTHSFPLAAITPDQVYAAAMTQPFQGRLLSEWASNLESDRLARITNAVRTGYLTGQSTDKIARNIRGTATNNYQDGAIQISRANATSITKTAINHIAATARTQFAEHNSDIVDCKQWLSTLDNKTTPTCIIRDRLKYSLENKPIGHKVPYLQGPGRIHFCCRSTETLVTKSWREMGIDADEMDAGTRASMDGQVPANTTYSEWLSQQSLYRQVQVLGDTRARLLRSGGMKVPDFFTDKGEWITLDKLKEIDADAFEKAGF
ncbi:hypothetical protein CWS43_09815 [Rahnella sp. AA]|uniref:hypothetical protein n=1 Tax=Rahnella sp. AA TaxID=2057180 RepID=UPI000C33BB50|nr:hypothetical protein [Rahnella sp. AA]PKE30968.1 hypothetical protein CWS43_09815 [Rahnella sp. AA]